MGEFTATVKLTGNNETESIASPAIEKVTAAIVEKNTAAVDAMTGAILTSSLTMNAVALCLEAAKQGYLSSGSIRKGAPFFAFSACNRLLHTLCIGCILSAILHAKEFFHA